MTDYYITTTARKTTPTHIEVQDDEADEEPDNTQRNDEGEEQPAEEATKTEKTGHRGEIAKKGKNTNRQETGKTPHTRLAK